MTEPARPGASDAPAPAAAEASGTLATSETSALPGTTVATPSVPTHGATGSSGTLATSGAPTLSGVATASDAAARAAATSDTFAVSEASALSGAAEADTAATASAVADAREAAAGSAPEAAALLPASRRDDDGPVFREPWEAETFAMVVALHERGAFSWGEWAAALGAEIARAQAAGDPDTGETAYRHWLAALERLATDKRLVDATTLARTGEAWSRAAARTPHGAPIELTPSDFD